MFAIARATTKLTYVFLAILYISAFVISIIGYVIGNRLLYGVFKAMVVPSIMAYTHIAWIGKHNKRYFVLQTAFFLAWIGDILIALPKIYTIFLFLGGWSFFFQHIIYIWLNLSARGPENSLWKTPYWGLPSIAYVALFSITYWSKGNLAERIQFSGYSFILGTSFYTSFYREVPVKSKYWIGIIGFGFFVLSDVVLLIDNFLCTLTDLQASSVLFTYYIAQALIAYTHILEPKLDTVSIQTPS